MDTSLLPVLLGLAVLAPLASFFTLLVIGRWLKPAISGFIATGAIVAALLLSLWSTGIWLTHHYPPVSAHHEGTHATADRCSPAPRAAARLAAYHADANEAAQTEPGAAGIKRQVPADDAVASPHDVGGPHDTGDYYVLGHFGKLRLTISYYIDSLTLVMFCVVSIIASCIHFYSIGYMHEEVAQVTDSEVTLANGELLKRRGRYWLFFTYLSLFCFSMLGLVLAGNVAMVFVFWELVGICSYFLIGFYIERKSASNAANKAFIVNRIGDFGMIIGLMALWAGLGTLAFGDVDANHNGHVERAEQGIFAQVRPAEHGHQLMTPEGLVRLSARDEIAQWARRMSDPTPTKLEQQFQQHVTALRDGGADGHGTHHGYWLLIVAGIGIFCGCIGKSAQFPLHVWLPDAMEGPTPVSALVHSATMVAAGVYLVGRFYPVFTPEVLLVIAVIGVITLFMAATIAITATDIKRVLAYSTVSQLGYMMMALGLGGWLAGMMHLVTHAFFKSLLFMCSGSVIHAVHTNEMPEMGGLLKKMPYTAYTMLVGCLAISGVSVPFLIGFSGYYSKDRILEQAYSFFGVNPSFTGGLFFALATGAAAITAFYMFRLWFMTFTGKPRDQHRYDHAHESPKVMYVPLIILAVFATGVAWELPFGMPNLKALLEQARPAGTAATTSSAMVGMTWPNEHIAHQDAQYWPIVVPVTLMATGTALGGILLAAAMYGFGTLDPREVRRQFPQTYRFLLNKWWFDELYDWLFVRRLHQLAAVIAAVDWRWIDVFIDGLAKTTVRFAQLWDFVADHSVVDRIVNWIGHVTYSSGLALRRVQTGSLRQYVMFLALALIAAFLIASALI